MKYRHLEIEGIGEDLYTIKNLATNKYVKMGARETKYLLQCLQYQGNEIVFKTDIPLNDDETDFMFQKFEEWGFLNENETVEEKKDITKIKICEINPSDALAKVPHWIQNLFSIRGAVIILALTFVAYYMIFQKSELVMKAAHDCLKLSLIDYITFYLLMICTTMLHELGHAICCNKNGGKVRSMGIMLFFLMPCFFCDVSDIYMFKDKKRSFGVAVSGIAINYIMGTLGCILFFILDANNVYVPLLLFYYLANLGFVAFNLIPFVKLDGYWVASSLLEVDNLMDKSILTFSTAIISPKELKNIVCSKSKKIKLFLYGLSAIVFRPFFWVISVYSAYQFLAAKNMSYLCGVVVGFVVVVVYKDVSDLLNRYVEMYKNQKSRVLGMI